MNKKYILVFFGGVILILVAVLFLKFNKDSVGANLDDNILEITIVLKGHKFQPDVITAPNGKKIRLIIHNQDNTVEEFESHDLHREKIIMPNDFIKIILAPLAPGKYDFFGDFHQETAQGSLIVN